MASLFTSGLSGLAAAQAGLATTGHNIANVNTQGYSRQRVDLATNPAQLYGNSYIGTGVNVASVQRVYDAYLTSQLRTSTSSEAALNTLQQQASGVDNLLGDASASLAPALQTFFGDMQAVNTNPTSVPERQVLVTDAQALAQRFNSLDQNLKSEQASVNSQLSGAVSQVNTLAAGVASLNLQIAQAQGQSGGQPANDLLDKRDELIRQIAQQVNVNVSQQSDGSVNVSVANGQALVVGATSEKLSMVPNQYDPARMEVGVTVGGNTSIISDFITGGTLGGLLQYRSQVLDAAQNGLGRTAIALSQDFNQQHQLGQDLNGVAGGNFFTDLASSAPQVLARSTNTGSPPAQVTATVTDSSALTTSDYRLERSGSTYTLTRLSDGQVTTLSSFPAGPQTVDGLTLSLSSGSIADGDSFLIEPTRAAAGAFGVSVTDPSAVAVAAPVNSAAGTANTGSGVISAASVNSPNDTLTTTFDNPPSTFSVVDSSTGATLAKGLSYSSGTTLSFNGVSFAISDGGSPPAAGDSFQVQRGVSAASSGNSGGGVISPATMGTPDPHLRDPVTITFDNPPSTFTVTGASTGSPQSGVPYVSGQPISYDGWTVSISGTPAVGDTFTVTPNTNGTGDNRNGLALAALQTANTVAGGTTSYAGDYGQLVSQVGTVTQQAQTNHDAQAAVLNQVTQAISSNSGVNLDEEAANLMQYQQAYSASARLITVAHTLFTTLLNAVG